MVNAFHSLRHRPRLATAPIGEPPPPAPAHVMSYTFGKAPGRHTADVLADNHWTNERPLSFADERICIEISSLHRFAIRHHENTRTPEQWRNAS